MIDNLKVVKMAPFIVIEGIDGSGKGTQTTFLKERLKEMGKDVFTTYEPTRSGIGRMIREHMSDPFLDDKTLALLFAADRIEHNEKKIIPALEADKVVISDRYVYSSIAYQGQTIDPDWVGRVNDHAMRPDLVVILDLPSNKVEERIGDRDDRDYFEVNRGFLEGARRMFIAISKGNHLPDPLKTRFLVVDSTMDKQEVASRIWDEVEQLI